MLSERKFEKLSNIKIDIPLPKRSTEFSAGYDISIIHPYVYKLITEKDMNISDAWGLVKEEDGPIFYLPQDKTNYVFPTGIKVKIPYDKKEFLALYIRSSIGIKQGITLSNQTGIIDADYYNNPDNEGHIMVALTIPERLIPDKEPSLFTTEYNKARYLQFDGPTLRICQGIFLPYETVIDDDVSNKRIGGIGSTGH
jgi:dUTP pyrophosphatase